MDTSVTGSTATLPMKMKAWVMVGMVWPMLSVPGIHSSFTSFHALNIAVVGAYEPMPRVSKKFVMKPMIRSRGPGKPSASFACAPRYHVTT